MSKVVEECLRRALTRNVEKPVIGVYYPSLLPSCLLRQYLIYSEGYTVGLEKSGVFKIGELFHGFLMNALKSSDAHVEVEKNVVLAVKRGDHWIKISGRVDAVLSIGDERLVLEIKSIASLPENPLEHHVVQIQPYLLALNASKGLIVYLEKKKLSWRIFETPFESKLFDRLVERAGILHEHLMLKRPPKPERSWECRYCEFEEKCRSVRGLEDECRRA